MLGAECCVSWLVTFVDVGEQACASPLGTRLSARPAVVAGASTCNGTGTGEESGGEGSSARELCRARDPIT